LILLELFDLYVGLHVYGLYLHVWCRSSWWIFVQFGHDQINDMILSCTNIAFSMNMGA